MIKCLTLTQPYATLIALEQKHIETRSWHTNYRGPLAIHAGKGLGPVGGIQGLRGLCCSGPFFSALKAAGIDLDRVDVDVLPLGAIVATCELIDVVSTNQLPVGWRRGKHAWWLTEQEQAFGDYSPNRYCWLLANVQALSEPIPCPGAQGLWTYAGPLPTTTTAPPSLPPR